MSNEPLPEQGPVDANVSRLLADMAHATAWIAFTAAQANHDLHRYGVPNGEVRGASRLAGEASASTVVLEHDNGGPILPNQNRCETCDYKKLNGNREKGHCYMFLDEPTDVCRQHTGRDFLRHFAEALRGRQEPLGEPFASILVDNLGELYETEDKGSNVKVTGLPQPDAGSDTNAADCGRSG